MRLYTIEHEGRELPSVEGKNGEMYTFESLGIPVKDMNELLVRFDLLKEEIGDVHNLDIACYVNDEERQNSSTAFMITTIEEAIAELSQGMTLKAGTIIATGTPGGVAMGMNPPKFLKKGDVVRCEISGIGKLVNVVG